MDDIISQMAGRELTNLFPPKDNKPGEVLLEVNHFSSIYESSFRDVSFQYASYGSGRGFQGR